MSTTSPLLKLTLQDLGENPDTWGSVLNTSGLRLLEDGITGAAQVVLASAADYTLDDTAGGPTAADGARNMAIVVSGSPGGSTNIIVPNRSKLYLVYNGTGDSSAVVIKTTVGTTTTSVPALAMYWVYCDGANNVRTISVSTANTATTATTATDSSQLTGVAGANFAQKGLAQTFTKGQVVQRQSVTLTAGTTLNIDTTLSNAFYHLTTGAFNLAAPTGATNGQQFSLIVEQGAGGPHAMTFQASTYMFQGGVAPSLSTGVGDIDYIAFEYVTGLSALGGARWIGSIIKDVGTV